MTDKIIIGITDCKKYDTYHQWVAQHPDDRIEIVKLSHHLHNLADLRKCHGIVLTGGEDVHPRFYNKPEYYEFCDKDDVSETRDEFEWQVLNYTKKIAFRYWAFAADCRWAMCFTAARLYRICPHGVKMTMPNTPTDKPVFMAYKYTPTLCCTNLPGSFAPTLTATTTKG